MGLKNSRYRSLFPYLALVSLVLFVALFAPFIAPMDPYGQNLEKALAPPDTVNILGTDRYGRDLFSRVIMGAQTTVFAALALLVVTTLTGTLIGAFCGFKGRCIDAFLMRLSDVFLAFPQMVFAIAASAALGGGLINAAVALAFIGWPKYARLARSLTLTVCGRPFVEAAVISGGEPSTILFRHILPNIAGLMLVTAALDLGTIIMELAGLSFLGLGAKPPTPEWGSMMSNGRSMLQTAPWVVLAPGTAIFLTVASFNLLGDKLRDFLDTKQLYK